MAAFFISAAQESPRREAVIHIWNIQPKKAALYIC
nr:MAG TPA: hypothetical protein [Caudoviricetes sp.]